MLSGKPSFMPIIFFIFIIIPIVEIVIFIQMGDWLGLGPTLVMIVLTAIIGVNLIRQQGLATLYKAQQKMNLGKIPAMEMIEGMMIGIAGALLITPGFFTDTFGFLLLVPFLRNLLFTRFILSKIKAQVQGKDYAVNDPSFNSSGNSHRTIDGDYKIEDDSK